MSTTPVAPATPRPADPAPGYLSSSLQYLIDTVQVVWRRSSSASIEDLEKAAAKLPLGAVYYADACRRAAELMDLDARCTLGGLYDQGLGVEHSKEMAFFWYRGAAFHGHPEAQFNLGTMYDHGEGIEESKELAAFWFEMSADQGYPPAQFNLGILFYNGEGVPQSDEKARYWIQKAAEQGYPPAEMALGWLFASGIGGAQSQEEAVYWYHRAAQRGPPCPVYPCG